MATVIKETRVTRPSRSTDRQERSVSEIIREGRKTRAPAWGAFGLSIVTGLLMWASFTPLDWGPLAWIAIVPVLLLARLNRRTKWMYLGLYAGSGLSWLATLQWMRLGDQTMYVAWLALTVYVAAYLPVFIGLTRVAVHRFGTPLVIAAPVVWVGLEFLRAHLITGFPWYFLGHTQHAWTSLLQVGDLVGAYGVSFVMVAVSAAMTTHISPDWLVRCRLLTVEEARSPENFVVPIKVQRTAVITSMVLLGATLLYGTLRRSTSEFETGPRVALVQGNFTASVKHNPSDWAQMFRIHRHLTGLTVKHQPDLIVWPETMFRWSLMTAADDLTEDQLAAMSPSIPPEIWTNGQVREVLGDLADETNAATIIGVDAYDANADGVAHYNSAVFIKPNEGIAARYDKLHRVPFGEYIPLRESLPWLQAFTPFGDDFGVAAGKRVHVFNDGQWRYLPLICFEDTVPHLVREMVASAQTPTDPQADVPQVDCLVNLTNDGWFHGSSELDQHLITARFRCIETRTPMVRAVNTGISAIIDGDGLVVEPEEFIDLEGMSNGHPRTSMRDPETGAFHKQLNCAIVGTLPLDPRLSLYVMTGDWFAGLCAACCLCLCVAGLFGRRRSTPALG